MRAAFEARVTESALRALNYSPEIERFRVKATRCLRLSSLLESMGPAYGAVFVRVDCAPEHGVELLTQGDMLAANPSGRWIRRDSMAHPERHEIKKWQVLIAGAGTLGETELYGRSIIADGRLVGRVVGPHAMVLSFKEPGSDMNLFAYAFLGTRIGIQAIRSASFGTKILGVRKDLLGELPVPVPDSGMLRKVADLIRRCVEKRQMYLRELEAARSTIEMLPEMRDAHAMCAERKARTVLWKMQLPTLRAWTYASSGGVLGYLSERWRLRLKDVVLPNGVFNGPRFARVECSKSHGIDFMSQRDVFLMRPIPRRIARPPISDRMLFVPCDAILVGSHGQLSDGGLFGKVELASFGGDRCGLTQDILRVLVKPEARAAVFAFLSTQVGERLLKATAVGTSIPLMRLDLLGEIPIPEIVGKQHLALEARVASAEDNRISAAKSEAEAIRIVEEEVLLPWLA